MSVVLKGFCDVGVLSNQEMLRRNNMRSFHITVSQGRLRLACHILQMEGQQFPKVAMRWTPLRAKHCPGCPRHTRRCTFIEEMKPLDVTRDDAEDAAEMMEESYHLICYLA